MYPEQSCLLKSESSATSPALIVLLGPTGVGKTALSLELAESLGTAIISADSRQIYREMPIGTAAPGRSALERVQHLFVGTHSIHEPYSVGLYEEDVLASISELHKKHDTLLLSGGSMMYIDAVCKGIDAIPEVCPDVRRAVYERYGREGLLGILEDLKELDPIYYAEVDKRNYKRVLHGYEVCISSGRPFSSFRTGQVKQRPFRIVKIGLTRPRAELYERINERVLEMMMRGLEEEAYALYSYRHLNALNTVGYKELFQYFDGSISRDEAIRRIQKNSRVYARKQETWWQRDQDIHWISPSLSAVIQHLTDLNIEIKR